MEKEMINLIGQKIIDINKIKVVLIALWRNEPHPEAQKIIDEFGKDIEEIEKGN